MKLSVEIITYNESKYLAGCIKSVLKYNPEIIIVDGYSTDNTLEIARKYNCKIIQTSEHKDYSLLRNIGITQCLGDWILILDTDERLESDITPLINDNRIDFWEMTQIFSDGTMVTTVRLFRNNIGIFYKGESHETPDIKPEHRLGNTNAYVSHIEKPLTEEQKQRKRELIIENIGKDNNKIKQLYYKGVICFDNSEFNLGIKYFQECLPLCNTATKAYIYNQLAEVYYMLLYNFDKLFIEAIGESLKLAPNQNNSRVLFADYLISKNKKDKAIEQLKIIEKRNGNTFSDMLIDKKYSITEIKNKRKELKKWH